MASIDDVRSMLRDLLGGPDASIAFRREQAEVFARSQPPLPPGVEVTAGVCGGVPVEWVARPTAPAWPVFVHLHGGGYVMGDPAGSRAFTVELALQTGARVVSVDYGLAPEAPFPAAVEDALAVYRSLLEHGAPPTALAVGGESAGGGLTVAMLLAAKDAGLPMPACAVAMSPWANLFCDSASYVQKHGADPLLTRDVLLEMARDYLAGADAGARWASPGLADLSGLPPMMIQVGSEEVLLDDAAQLAERARACGVEVDLQVWEGMIHVWQMFHPMLPEGTDAIARISDFLVGHWPVAGRV